MAERGIHIVRAHLAKLPPSDSLTIAERRAQYERAEKVFPPRSEEDRNDWALIRITRRGVTKWSTWSEA